VPSAEIFGRRRRSRTSHGERARRAETIASALRRYVQWLCSLASIKVAMVIFFGSYVKGTWRAGSDVDLIVVADGLPRDAVDCYVFLTDTPDTTIDVEPHPYAPEDFLASLRSGNKMPFDALTEGQILYIDPDFKETLLAALGERP